MSLQEISPGDEADATVLMDNFRSLDERITQEASGISDLQSTIASVQATLSASINNMKTEVLKTLYPVGSIYIGTQSTCPLASLFGTWTKVAANRVLQGSSSSHSATENIAAGLPNVTGTFASRALYNSIVSRSGALNETGSALGYAGSYGASSGAKTLKFDASASNSVYGNASTVQPPAYVVNVWRRTA
jgi:hypothetical protein